MNKSLKIIIIILLLILFGGLCRERDVPYSPTFTKELTINSEWVSPISPD